MDKRTSKVAAAALLAGVAGYLVGVLTAPKSGKETRQDIKNAANAKRVEIERQLKRVHTELAEQITKFKTRAKDLKGKAKQEADGLLEVAAQAKDKARLALSAVRDGEAEDTDLQKAIHDAEKAVEHLKQYIIKK